MTQLPVRFPDEDYQALRNLAHFSGTSMNAIVVRVVHDFLVDVGRDEQLGVMVSHAESQYRQLLDRLAAG